MKTSAVNSRKTPERKTGFLHKFIGDKAFYKMVLAIAVPIMIQNGITNFVGLLDNIMIGRVGTEPMSGVAIVNQLIFVYNLCLFGGVSGAGIFTAQYYGQKNHEGIRQTVRFKIWIVALITLFTTVLFLLAGDNLIQLYLLGEGTVQSAAATLHYGRQYLFIMLTGLLPFMMVQVYSSTLRECGQTLLPMKAGIIAVCVNLVLNYILIYGKFGAPALGVQGAAIATVISRYVEAAIILVHTHRRREQNPFVEGLYSTLKVPGNLVRKILIKGTPLLLNETLWAAGMAMLSQCYSVRGLNVIAAQNISSTIGNVFNIVFIALGDSVAIIVGQLLGAGKMEEARDHDNKLIAFSVFCCTCVALLMLVLAPLFPMLYNTEADVLAKYFIMINAVFMPQNAFLHASYFTLRSGGKTIVTFLFDSVFIWCVSVTIAFTLSRFTSLPVTAVFILVQMGDIIKCIIGFVLVKKGVWMQNIVA
jgi:putative MATE family efflux protein